MDRGRKRALSWVLALAWVAAACAEPVEVCKDAKYKASSLKPLNMQIRSPEWCQYRPD